jgi:hypothetical protein
VEPYMEKWVRHVVNMSATYPHVFYQVANESFICNASPSFEKGVKAIARNQMKTLGVSRIIGTNAGPATPSSSFDYRTYHQFNTVPQSTYIPVLVNETDNLAGHCPEQYEDKARKGLTRPGVYFEGFRDGLSLTDFKRMMRLLGGVIRDETIP